MACRPVFVPAARLLRAASFCGCFLGAAAAQSEASFAEKPMRLRQESLYPQLWDLERLLQPVKAPGVAKGGPVPAYRVRQFSSYDRRSTTRDAPGWFMNSDGFGREPRPGFEKVLEGPSEAGHGLFLICDVQQPGAIVRTWSAGMAGELCVEIDGEEVYRGDARRFWRRKSEHYFSDLDEELRRYLMQEDADYLPMQFGQRLRMTWRGSVRELHFYAMQVRLYEGLTQETTVEPFLTDGPSPAQVLGEQRGPVALAADSFERWAAEIPIDGVHDRVLEAGAGWGVLRELRLRVAPVFPGPLALTVGARDQRARLRNAALEGIVLQIYGDGAQEPLVEAPLRAFFGSAFEEAPFNSVALEVQEDGWRICRFPMPFAKELRLRLRNWSGHTVRLEGRACVEPLDWDAARSDEPLRFRARYRVDHGLAARGGAEPIDLPYLVAIGSGRVVGAACMLSNPLPDPRRRSNWWGEGDEKIFVDGEKHPSLFGTGSEDYFNYSWSHWNRFDHPYCGQPLNTGPGNCGYVSNHRLHVIDDVPFKRSLAFYMELWTHVPVEQVSYGRIVWWYGAAGAIDDHRRLQPSELRPRALPRWPDEVWSKEGESTVQRLAVLVPETFDSYAPLPHRLSRSAALLEWFFATPGEELRLPLFAAEEGRYAVELVALHAPDGGALSATLAGQALRFGDAESFVLRSGGQERLLGVSSGMVALEAGPQELVLRCETRGTIALDHVHLRLRERAPLRIADLVEAEDLKVVQASPDLEHERQGMPADRWSGGRHLWVKATEVGDFITLELPVPEAGTYRLALRLTSSWDYGMLRVHLGDRVVVKSVDTFNTKGAGSAVLPLLELGEHELRGLVRLRLEVVGRNEAAADPGCYFGLDGVLLRRP